MPLCRVLLLVWRQANRGMHAGQAVVSNASVWDTVKLIPSNALPTEWKQEAMATPACDSFMHLHLGFDATGPLLPCLPQPKHIQPSMRLSPAAFHDICQLVVLGMQGKKPEGKGLSNFELLECEVHRDLADVSLHKQPIVHDS